MDFLKLFESCCLCPRECGVNRLGNGNAACSGFCRESHDLRVAHVGPHYGEEPPITGKNGSGTIFFTGCSLGCSFCQNHQISSGALGKTMDINELLTLVKEMIRINHVQNINFVTPDHFFPHTFLLASLLRQDGYNLPIIHNLSGYQSVDMIRIAGDYADIYLPDFKYADPSLSLRFSKCKDYPKVALEAISEMIRQKGFLAFSENGSTLARKGVLVRHLILPGNIKNSLDVLTTLFLEFGPGIPISLMSQYHPVLPMDDSDMNRSLTREEFDMVYSHTLDLGFEILFVQFPDNASSDQLNSSPFLPDFSQETPFGGEAS